MQSQAVHSSHTAAVAADLIDDESEFTICRAPVWIRVTSVDTGRQVSYRLITTPSGITTLFIMFWINSGGSGFVCTPRGYVPIAVAGPNDKGLEVQECIGLRRETVDRLVKVFLKRDEFEQKGQIELEELQ